MNLTKLDFTVRSLLDTGGPVKEEMLEATVLACSESEDERERIDIEGLESTLTEAAPWRNLLWFGWESWGAPISWNDSMALVSMVNNHFICMPWSEGVHPFVVLSAVSFDDAPSAIAASVQAILSESFDWEFLGRRLPTSTHNAAPDILPTQAVKDAYRAAAANSDETWSALLDDLLGLTDDPQLQSFIRSLPDLPEEQLVAMDAATRSQLFEKWFSLTYGTYGEERAAVDQFIPVGP